MPDEPPISLTGEPDDLEGPIVKLIQVTSIDANLKQEVFITTVDKARNCLRESLSRMEQRNAWVTPAGILATIAVIFPTANFQDFIISKDTWRAIFIVSAVASAVWLIRCLWRRLNTKMQTVDDVINELRRGSSVPITVNAAPAASLDLPPISKL